MNTRSLRFRLIAWYAGLLTGVFVLFGSSMFLGVEHYLVANLGESQTRRARQLGETLLNKVEEKGQAYVIEEIKARYAPEINDRFIRVTNEKGEVVYVSGAPRDQSFDSDHLPMPVRSSKAGSLRKEKLPGGRTLLVSAVDFQCNNSDHYLVEVGAPLTSIESLLKQLLLFLALGLPIVVAVAVGGGFFLVQRALAPVDKIARSAEQITLHNISERLPVAHTGDELERLSISLNHMITRLEEAFQNSTRFVADASHELRTPLTVLRGELEAMIEQEQMAPTLRESIGSVLEEVERLAKIVERLFALSRLDAGEAQREWVKFDLAKLAMTTAEQMELLAQDKGISVSCEAPAPIAVEGDRARLKQVVVNLLDNAIKYTPKGGSISLKVSSVNSTAVLEVADNGIGIPSEDLPHVFERFFRVDKARTREMGGAGLGLAIVKSICTAHGAQVEVQSTEGSGSRFKVELPLAPAFEKKQEKNEH